jgi:GDP-L-fucose synthase
MNRESTIYIAGHRGMVGSSIGRRLRSLGYENIIERTSKELDLRNQKAVQEFMQVEKPDYVFVAAAKVGGIHANNTYRAEFLYDNLIMEANLIDAAYRAEVTKLMFLGSSCIYPKLAEQPLKEDYLLSGYLEETNEPYAIAKIAGIKLCETYREQYGVDFISAMPTNLYGPGDNYDLNNSHVLPAMIRKFHEAKEDDHRAVNLWGDGSPMREFLHTDDLAEALVYLMENYSEKQFINVGYGSDVTIKELAELVQSTVGHRGEINWDATKPNGTPRKLMDIGKLRSLGWKPKISLQNGIEMVYKDFLVYQEKYKIGMR